MTSDVNYLELDQTSQVKGTVLHKTALISDTSCKCRGLQATFTSDQVSTNLGIPTTPSGLKIH